MRKLPQAKIDSSISSLKTVCKNKNHFNSIGNVEVYDNTGKNIYKGEIKIEIFVSDHNRVDFYWGFDYESKNLFGYCDAEYCEMTYNKTEKILTVIDTNKNKISIKLQE